MQAPGAFRRARITGRESCHLLLMWRVCRDFLQLQSSSRHDGQFSSAILFHLLGAKGHVPASYGRLVNDSASMSAAIDSCPEKVAFKAVDVADMTETPVVELKGQ